MFIKGNLAVKEAPDSLMEEGVTQDSTQSAQIISFKRNDDADYSFFSFAPASPDAGSEVAVNAERLRVAWQDLPVHEEEDERGLPESFNFLLALGAIILAAPIMAVVALVIKLTSKGPAIFVQKRVTQGGRVFNLYKFRSMVECAESKGAAFASKNDSRVTPVGHFLRKTRLDELPQLFNVLKGEMAIVGPRPERPEFVNILGEKYKGFHKRTKVKAGLTGLAQVMAGYVDCVESYKRKLAFDRLYLRKRSKMLDLWILFKTVGVVLTGKGAQ